MGCVNSNGWNVGGVAKGRKNWKKRTTLCVVLESPDINVFACNCVAKLLLSTFFFLLCSCSSSPFILRYVTVLLHDKLYLNVRVYRFFF